MNTTFIYSLEDPITGQIRYVGKSNNIKKRLVQHRFDNHKSYKTNWIKSLKDNNLEPILNIIDEVPKEEWSFWEKHYISLYKSWGFKLTNGTDGGDGCHGGKPSWNSGKKGLNAWNKGISPSIETRNKISLKLKGNKPWNTGTVGIKPPNSGSFKKGTTPKNKGVTKVDLTIYNSLILKYKEGSIILKDIMKELNISYTTLYKLNKKFNN